MAHMKLTLKPMSLVWLLLAVCHVVAWPCAIARGDDLNISALPGLQWWASAQDSKLARNPDGTGAAVHGSPVGYMADLSGHGNNAVMGDSICTGGDADRPTLQARVIDGRPAIYFNGSNFLSLQHALFNGGSGGTIVLALAGANFAPDRHSTLFGSAAASMALSRWGLPTASARLSDKSSIDLSIPGYGPIWGVTKWEGPETTIIVAARFRPGGTSDLWVNNVLISSKTNGSAGQKLTSPAISLLGAQNVATTGGAISVPSGTPSKFYFLEGMAASTALSDTQLSQVYNYLTQRYTGIQNLAISPNLYYDAAANPQRTVRVPFNAGHIQGVGAGNGYRYVFYTAMIEKYDADWKLIASNQSLATRIVRNGVSLHSGGGTYLAGKIFAPLEKALGPGGQWIGVYDANKRGLPLIASVDVSAHQQEFSALTIVPSAGKHGVIFGTSFYARLGGSQLTMYDYAGGNVTSSRFGAFLGSLPIPATITDIQGVAWKAPYFYFSAGTTLPGSTGGIQRVLYQNGKLSSQAELVWNYSATVQGIGFEGSNILEAIQPGGKEDQIATFASGKFTSVGNGAASSWTSNANGAFSDPTWDPAMPNAAGATAVFGKGTTNAGHVAAMNITVDAPYVVGSLIFNPTDGTNYTLAGDKIPTHALMLTSGAETGARVSVSSGSQTIATNLVLADGGGHRFKIPPKSQLTVSGSISEILGSQSLTLTGGGTLVLAHTNQYTGGTTVTAGTLQTAADGALGSGSLSISAAAGVASNVRLAGNETLATLSADVAAGGAAIISEASGKTLCVGKLSKTGSGTLQLQTTLVLTDGSAPAISGGAIDIGGSGLVIQYGSGPDPLEAINNLLKSGYNGGDWSGTAIISSLAAGAAHSPTPLKLEVRDFRPGKNGDPESILFAGQRITTNAVLARLTKSGE